MGRLATIGVVDGVCHGAPPGVVRLVGLTESADRYV